jgi:hypothetical protein
LEKKKKMYELLTQLEDLIAKWEHTPYAGDLTKAAKMGCAKELRAIIGKPDEGNFRAFSDKQVHDEACKRRYTWEE